MRCGSTCDCDCDLVAVVEKRGRRGTERLLDVVFPSTGGNSVLELDEPFYDTRAASLMRRRAEHAFAIESESERRDVGVALGNDMT